MFHLLIVDEEEHLLWALENNLLPEREDIKILTAHSGEAALEILKQRVIEVLICDIKMPGKVDGFQLILRAKEIAPDARVVIMTAFGTNRIQNLAERIGITHYIEKPFNISDLRNVILELLDAKEGFQGVLSDLELTDIIQMLCLAKRTTLLHLKHKEHRGKILFERGEVVHAEFDELVGADAVYHMLALKRGDIYMQSDFQSDKRTIHLGWQDLLLEGVRRADEQGALGDITSRPEDDDDGHFLAMPPRLTQEVDAVAPPAHPPSEEGAVPSFFSEAELEEIEAAAMDSAPVSAPASTTSQHHTLSGHQNASSGAHQAVSGAHDRAAAAHQAVAPRDHASLPDADEASTQIASPRELLLGAREALIDSSPSGWPRAAHNQQEQPFSRREITEPTAIAREARHSGPQQALYGAAPIMEEVPTHELAPLSVHRSPSMLRAASGAFSVPNGSFRTILQDFARECTGLRTTGLFSESNGMALEFAHGPHTQGYDGDTVSAFFREVIASANNTVRSLHEQDAIQEVQLLFGEEIFLMRRLHGTSYIHIAVMHKDVRLGIAIVLMRRYGQRLAESLLT